MQNKYITFIVSFVGCVNCKHAKGWENKVCVGIDLRGKYI